MAQTISLDKLYKLAKLPVAEAEGSKFFSKFKTAYTSAQKEFSKSKAGNAASQGLMPVWTYRKLKKTFLKDNCPPIEYIGEGSSRAAYALDGGLCLKIAMSEAGVAQNKAEAKNTEKMPKRYQCFTALHGMLPKCEAILVECVAVCKGPDGVKKAAGMLGCHDASSYLLEFIVDVFVRMLKAKKQRRCKWLEAAEAVAASTAKDLKKHRDDPDAKSYFEVASAMSSPKTPAQKTLQSLARFVLENPDDMIIGDLRTPENWGFAARNGAVVPVVLDSGFSREVADKWY